MTKKQFLYVFILTLFAVSCHDEDWEYRGRTEGSPASFTIKEAQSYFEEHADALEVLRMGNKTTRSSELPAVDLSANWKLATLSHNNEAVLVEVPVEAIAPSIVCVQDVKNDTLTQRQIRIVKRRLIIAKRKSGVIQMFMATLVPLPEKALMDLNTLVVGISRDRCFVPHWMDDLWRPISTRMESGWVS